MLINHSAKLTANKSYSLFSVTLALVTHSNHQLAFGSKWQVFRPQQVVGSRKVASTEKCGQMQWCDA